MIGVEIRYNAFQAPLAGTVEKRDIQSQQLIKAEEVPFTGKIKLIFLRAFLVMDRQQLIAGKGGD